MHTNRHPRPQVLSEVWRAELRAMGADVRVDNVEKAAGERADLVNSIFPSLDTITQFSVALSETIRACNAGACAWMRVHGCMCMGACA